MKMVILALSTLFASAAMASVHVGPACTPGTSAFLSELQSNGKYVQAFKTCLNNGRFYADEATPVARKCVEGSKASFSEIQTNGKYKTVVRTCFEGRFYPKAHAVILKCTEGATANFPEITSNGRWTDNYKTCRNGVFSN